MRYELCNLIATLLENDPESSYCHQDFLKKNVIGCDFVPSVSEFSIMFSCAADGDFSLSDLP